MVMTIMTLLQAYYREMEKLSRVLLRIIALGLGLEEHFFDPLEDKHWSALRCLNYPHSEKPFAPGQMRIAAHTDYGEPSPRQAAWQAGSRADAPHWQPECSGHAARCQRPLRWLLLSASLSTSCGFPVRAVVACRYGDDPPRRQCPRRAAGPAQGRRLAGRRLPVSVPAWRACPGVRTRCSSRSSHLFMVVVAAIHPARMFLPPLRPACAITIPPSPAARAFSRSTWAT